MKHPPNPIILDFNNVSFSYEATKVLDSASFHLHQGEFVALIGPNGAGKTTILRLLLGLSEPTKGSITLYNSHPKTGRANVGYVPQHASYDPSFPISVEEVVRMGRLKPFKRRYSQKDVEETKKVLKVMELSHLAKRPYSMLSGGQRRRVLVARALSANPKMLILDEPTTNMDVDSEKRLFDALGKLKGETTVLIVTHDTGFVTSLTDRVLCLGQKGPSKQGSKVVQHKVAPVKDVPGAIYGGDAVKVLHDEHISADQCIQVGEQV